MRSGALRIAIIVAAVLAGVLVLTKGFPSAGGTIALPTSKPTHSQSSPTPKPTKSKHASPSPPAPKCKKQGTQVAVYNASHTTGLAAATASKLQAAGYVLGATPGNAPTSNTTFLYYKTAKDKVEAMCLEQDFFKGARIEKLPPGTNVPGAVQVAVYLGIDYASKHPVG